MWTKLLKQAGKRFKESSEAIEKILEAYRDKCSNCLYWKTNKCTHRKDQNILFPTDRACSDGLVVHFLDGNIIIKQHKTQLSKPIQYLTAQSTKEELNNTFGLSPTEVEWTIRKILEKHQIKKRAHEKLQHSVGAILKDGRIYEQIRDHRYALYQSGQVSYVDRVENFVPYARLPWPLCTKAADYESKPQLYEDIHRTICEYLDHPDPDSYHVLASWIMATWMPELFNSVPYLQFYGPFESGKTRALEILSQLSFRGWLSLYTTASNLFRPIQKWRPTLLLDESEIYGDQSDVMAILNAGYRRNPPQYVPRQVEDKSGEYHTELFNVWGFKALASTETFARTLVSRCLTFKMSKATREVKLFINQNQMTKLRNQLLMYRFKTLGKNNGENGEGGEAGEAFSEG